MNGSITPKTGNTFIGQYGAILDGTGWTTTDDSQAAFRVYDDPNDPNDPTTADRQRDHQESRDPQHAPVWHPWVAYPERQ
jgi:hypothetical protein